MEIFFRNIKKKENITWGTLIEDINKTSTYNPYCKADEYYQVFKHIIISILLGEEVILLDSDFTNYEIKNLTGYSKFDEFTVPIKEKNKLALNKKKNLVEKIRNTNNNWKITLFTSGTTGKPKKITHSFKSITRFVKITKQTKDNIWGFAYNPTHIAGVQVFFQALLNGNKIVRIFGLPTEQIYSEIKENNISHISATPTFFKLLLPSNDVFPSVKRITSGGENLNKKIAKEMKKVFPNAKITNVYASTEAGTLLASENDVFTIKKEYENLIKINNGELLIHHKLMGTSEIEIKKWYHTGDLVEVIEMSPLKFRFVSRKSEMINVGGYKVNPSEVEEIILNYPGIKNVYVYSKSNSVLGSIIYCDIVCDNKRVRESDIRKFLQTNLQEFKIPRIFRFVNEISMTRTGKIKRG